MFRFTRLLRKIRRVRRWMVFAAVATLAMALPIAWMALRNAPKAEAAWFDGNWGYRQRLSFTNSGSAVTNQKVKFDVDTEALVTAGTIQSDCDDLRFTDIGGKTLQYYLDSSGGACNTNSTDIYVLFPSIIAGENIAYMYYGNPLATAGTQAAQFGQSTFSPGAGPSFASAETAPGPYLYWKFDEGQGQTFYESSTNNKGGTLGANSSVSTDDPTWQTEDKCVSGKCLYFDGGDQGTLSSNILPTGAFTVSFWTKANTVSTGVLFWNFETQISLTGTGSVFTRLYNGSTSYSFTTAANTITANKWHHVTFVYDTSTIYLYVDNKLAGSTSASGNRGAGAASIGKDETAASFVGYLDEFKIYNYARSTTQIKSDYLQGARNLGSSANIGGPDQDFLSEGLIGYWKMDESSGNAADSSGNGSTLTNTNTVTYSSGKFGSASDYEDGSSQYQYVADSTTLSLTGNVTISSWIKPESVTASTSFDIAGKWDGSNESYLLSQFGDEIRFYVDSSSNYVTTTASNLAAGNWYHVVGVYSASTATATIYINGAVATTTTTGTIPSSIGDDTGRFQVGAEDSTTTAASFYDGMIDEVRLYSRVFSSTEVRNLYNWAPGPVGYWNFDEASWTNDCSTDSVFDISGNGLHGDSCANGNGPTTPGVGKYGNGVSLDGSNDYISVADNDALDFSASQDFTVSAWVKIPSTNQPNTDVGSNPIVEKWAGSGGYPYVIRYVNHTGGGNAGKIIAGRYDGTNNPAIVTTSSVNDDTFHYVTLSKRGGVLSLYFDGKLQATGVDTTTGTTTNSSVVAFGVRPAGTPAYYLQGVVDEVKIYNYARTSTQIIEDMNGGHPLGGSPVGSPIAHWKFDEQQGQTARDSIPNGNNGTLGANTSSSTDDPTWKTGSDCKIGGCLQFDGGDYVTVGNITAYKIASKSATFWAKPTTSISTTASVTSFQAANWYTGFTATNRMITSHTIGAGNQATNSTPNSTVSTNEWHHYGYTWDYTGTAVTVKFYKDGKLVQTGTSTAGYGTTYGSSFILGSFATTSGWFTGYLDEIKLYNGALTEDQIRLDYNAGAAVNYGTGASSEASTLTDGAGNAPLAEWKLDEKTGTSALDTSGNNQTGTLTSGPSWTTGKIGSAVSFDGVDDHIVTSSVTGSNSTGTNISFWLKTTATTGVAVQWGNNRQCRIGVVTANKISCYVDGNAAGSATSTTSINDGNWHYISLSSSTGAQTIYVDGKPEATATETLATSTGAVYLGSTNSPLVFLNGLIDQVTLYDYGRTASQVAYDYNRGRPVGHWKFDECQGTSLYDSSGNGNTGTWNGTGAGTQTAAGTCNTSSTAWGNGATGKFNSSLNFDGGDDYVNIPDPSSGILDFGTGNFTLSAWVKTTNTTNDLRILTKGGGGTPLYQLIKNTAGTSGFYIRDSSGVNAQVSSTTNIANGSWHHVTGTKVGTTLSIYIDGKLENTTTYAGGAADNAVALTIGQFGNGNLFFSGQIDDVQIFNYGLSATQVKQIMNEGAGVRFGPQSGSP